MRANGSGGGGPSGDSSGNSGGIGTSGASGGSEASGVSEGTGASGTTTEGSPGNVSTVVMAALREALPSSGLGSALFESIQSGSLDGQPNLAGFVSSALLGHKACHACGERDPPLRCSQCLIPSYCNKLCQTSDWSRHKAECKKLALEGGEDSKKGRAVDRGLELARLSVEAGLKEKEKKVKAVLDAHGKDAAIAEVMRLHEEEQSPAELERSHAESVACILQALIEEGDFDTALNCAVDSLEEPGNAAVAVSALGVMASKGQGLAHLFLAHCALEGRGMEVDVPRGVSLLETAATLLSGAPRADALCCLARVLTEENEGVRQVLGVADSGPPNPHLVRAFHLLATSAQRSGDAVHILLLARAHLIGIGTPVDAEAGVAALQVAADMGYNVALHDLSVCYSSGVGVPRKDKARAKDLLQRAKEAGFQGKRKLGDWVNVVHW